MKERLNLNSNIPKWLYLYTLSLFKKKKQLCWCALCLYQNTPLLIFPIAAIFNMLKKHKRPSSSSNIACLAINYVFGSYLPLHPPPSQNPRGEFILKLLSVIHSIVRLPCNYCLLYTLSRDYLVTTVCYTLYREITL